MTPSSEPGHEARLVIRQEGAPGPGAPGRPALGPGALGPGALGPGVPISFEFGSDPVGHVQTYARSAPGSHQLEPTTSKPRCPCRLYPRSVPIQGRQVRVSAARSVPSERVSRAWLGQHGARCQRQPRPSTRPERQRRDGHAGFRGHRHSRSRCADPRQQPASQLHHRPNGPRHCNPSHSGSR